METGTGKTYVYIKTIMELHKRYGWSKYIVVVPSIAIRGREEVVRHHRRPFQQLYGTKPRRSSTTRRGCTRSSGSPLTPVCR
jgi:type III restriction enzyme